MTALLLLIGGYLAAVLVFKAAGGTAAPWRAAILTGYALVGALLTDLIAGLGIGAYSSSHFWPLLPCFWALHAYRNEDGYWCVAEGEPAAQAGDKEVHVGSGVLICAPRASHTPTGTTVALRWPRFPVPACRFRGSLFVLSGDHLVTDEETP